VTWTRKKRRRKARKLAKAEAAKLPRRSASQAAKRTCAELMWFLDDIADDGPGGLHDVDLSLPGD
jgi:hypothetical protein